MTSDADALEPLLANLHGKPDQDAALKTLARRCGYSPFHFHRLFSESVGETPKRYVARVRLERAAYLLAVTDARILSIALDVGFSSHETFARAFRRGFGLSPSAYRAAARKAQSERLRRNAGFTGDGCTLSEPWFGALPPTRLLAIHHVGAYSQLRMPPFSPDDGLWRTLEAAAKAARVAYERTAWVICHDDPTLTPGPRQRLDAVLPIGVELQAPGLKCMEFKGGRYAGVEHVGPLDTIDQAYRHVADGIRRSPRYGFGVGPPVQIFRHIDADPARCRTEIFFPIVRR